MATPDVESESLLTPISSKTAGLTPEETSIVLSQGAPNHVPGTQVSGTGCNHDDAHSSGVGMMEDRPHRDKG